MAQYFTGLLKFLCKLNGFFDGIIRVVMRIFKLSTDPGFFHSAVLKPLPDLLAAQTYIFGDFSLLLPGRQWVFFKMSFQTQPMDPGGSQVWPLTQFYGCFLTTAQRHGHGRDVFVLFNSTNSEHF